jgi:hypothetical protein
MTERRLLIVLSLLATYVFFFEYLPPFKRVHVSTDIEVFNYPLQRYAFQSLKDGRLPQWDPGIYCGVPFTANIQTALFYPPTWLMYAASWRQPIFPFKALECFVFAHVWLAFVLCYLWLRSRALDPLACALAAAGFAYGGYMLWQIVHPGMVAGLAWMPLALWGIDDGRRFSRKASFACALSFLAGYPPAWVAFCAVLLFYALASRNRWRAALTTFISIAVSVPLAAVQWLPLIEARPYLYAEERYAGELRPTLIPLFVPDWLDFNRSSAMHYLAGMYIYCGIAAVFALLWILRRRDWRPYVQPLAVFAISLLFVLDPGGVHPPLSDLLQSYNFYEGVAIAMALAAALVLTDFFKPTRKTSAWFVLPLAAWTVREIFAYGHTSSGLRNAAETALALALFALALRAPRRAVAAVVLVLFVLVDFKIYGTNRLFNTIDGDVDELQRPHEIRGTNAEAYRALTTNRQYRIASDETGAPGPTEYRMWGLATPQGIDPLITKQYRAIAPFRTNRVLFFDFTDEPLLQLLGVRYAVTHNGAALANNTNFRLIGPDDSFYRVYEFLHAHPPYTFSGEIRVTGWQPERRAFQVHSATGGLFTLAEQFFPGWRAEIDGRPIPIHRWHTAFQSIQIPPGDHTIGFAYGSRLLPLGGAVSLLSVILVSLSPLIRSFKPNHSRTGT